MTRQSLLTLAGLLACLTASGCGDDGTGSEATPSSVCCNPAEEPGVGGNPFCFEGASCCADGTWQCNGDSGQDSCGTAGGLCLVSCDPADEPGVGANPPCIEGASCCPDGLWTCNNGAGEPACAGP